MVGEALGVAYRGHSASRKRASENSCSATLVQRGAEAGEGPRLLGAPALGPRLLPL
jgi:hypothetical protein